MTFCFDLLFSKFPSSNVKQKWNISAKWDFSRPYWNFNLARPWWRRCILSAEECREAVPSLRLGHLCWLSPRSLRVSLLLQWTNKAWRLLSDFLTILHLVLISDAVLLHIIRQRTVEVFGVFISWFVCCCFWVLFSFSIITVNTKVKRSKGTHKKERETQQRLQIQLVAAWTADQVYLTVVRF